MNAVLLPQIYTQALKPEESAEQSDDSSDTSSDSDELQTLTHRLISSLWASLTCAPHTFLAVRPTLF
jgi:hypothetical protein